MNKIVELMANGTITAQDLVEASPLIERAELVNQGIQACKKTLVFPLGASEINCYSYMDSAGEYEAWGKCNATGIFTCFCNWGGNHQTGSCDLTSFESVFLAFENKELASDLKNFLEEQIEKAGL